MSDNIDKDFKWFYVLIALALIILILTSLVDGTFELALNN